jgi:hypothetical protein
MHRRQFFQLASAALWLPVGSRPCLAAIASLPRHDYLFFDERFQRARHIAADWSLSGRPVSVDGDVTPAWNGGLDRQTRERQLLMRGVTVDSFLFCLKVLLSEHAELSARARRIDRNLIHWSMSTTPKLPYGTKSWPSPCHQA